MTRSEQLAVSRQLLKSANDHNGWLLGGVAGGLGGHLLARPALLGTLLRQLSPEAPDALRMIRQPALFQAAYRGLPPGSRAALTLLSTGTSAAAGAGLGGLLDRPPERSANLLERLKARRPDLAGKLW